MTRSDISFFPGAKCGQLLDKLGCIFYFKYVNRIESAESESILVILSVYMNDYTCLNTSFDYLTLLFSSLLTKI